MDKAGQVDLPTSARTQSTGDARVATPGPTRRLSRGAALLVILGLSLALWSALYLLFRLLFVSVR